MDVHLQTEKNVFVIFYAGEKAKAKILKICEAFGANRYPFAEELGKQAQMITEVGIGSQFPSVKSSELPVCQPKFLAATLFNVVHVN